MRNPLDHIDQLSAWLAASDIDVLELRGPDQQHMRLKRRSGTVDVQNLMDINPREAGEKSRCTVTADTPGLFLHHHPLHSAALVQPDVSIKIGQILGLLQIGSLLLPVMSPCDGRVEGVWVAHRTAVGFGTPLIELLANEA